MDLIVINVYGPTTAQAKTYPNEQAIFYEHLKQLVDEYKTPQYLLYIMEDLTPKWALNQVDMTHSWGIILMKEHEI